MIEVVPGSVAAGTNSLPPLANQADVPTSLGRQTFRGEIVDSKCFFGVMNPGQLKPHRACAVRCISGGIPPILLVRQTNGTTLHLLHVGRAGQPVNQEVLPLVAEPVEIYVEPVRHGVILMLRADPGTYRRL